MDGDLGSEKHYLTNANSKNKLFKFIILIAFVLFIIVLAFIGLVYFAYWKYSDSVP
jgi:nitrate reductase NapE component